MKSVGRTLGCFALACLPLAAPAAGSRPADADWSLFKQQFLRDDGRVVDPGQGGISHSEGQGYAMLLAVHHDDRAAFDRLWQWTRANLQVRGDALLAWRWVPGQGVTDRNDASDADLLVAWALVRAGRKWQCDECAAAAKRIARDIRRLLLRRVAHGLVLLPGLEGFEKPEGATVNLSYWIFPALAEIGEADPAPEWDELTRTGIALLGYSHFGRWGLPPDWLRLGERVAPAPGFPERFGHDAVRIPLYLLWGRKESQALLKPYREFWAYFDGARFLPGWTHLGDDSVDSYDAAAGVRAIARAVADYPDARAERLPALEAGQPYYSSVLLLLCKVALRERAGAALSMARQKW